MQPAASHSMPLQLPCTQVLRCCCCCSCCAAHHTMGCCCFRGIILNSCRCRKAKPHMSRPPCCPSQTAVSYRRSCCPTASAACQAPQAGETAGRFQKHPRIARVAVAALRHRKVCWLICCCAAAAGLPGACRPGRRAPYDTTPRAPSPGTTKRRSAQKIRPTGLIQFLCAQRSHGPTIKTLPLFLLIPL